MTKAEEKRLTDYYDNLLNKFKQDPLFEQKRELGSFLMRHIDDLSEQERRRYDELVELLKDSD